MATPTMLPVPTREARPTAKAWKEEIPPSLLSREEVMARTMWGKSRSCTAPVRMVKYNPPRTSSQASR